MRDFRITGLPVDTFRDMFSASDAALAAAGMRRVVVDGKPGFPCRVSLVDADIGETVILGHYRHHDVAGPYAASGPIFVREAASRAYDRRNEIPPVLRGRLLSVRAYRSDGLLQAADVVEHAGLESLITRLSEAGDTGYLHVHNARPGCFMCRIDPF